MQWNALLAPMRCNTRSYAVTFMLIVLYNNNNNNNEIDDDNNNSMQIHNERINLHLEKCCLNDQKKKRKIIFVSFFGMPFIFTQLYIIVLGFELNNKNYFTVKVINGIVVRSLYREGIFM